jgi:hypothetical protein
LKQATQYNLAGTADVAEHCWSTAAAWSAQAGGELEAQEAAA